MTTTTETTNRRPSYACTACKTTHRDLGTRGRISGTSKYDLHLAYDAALTVEAIPADLRGDEEFVAVASEAQDANDTADLVAATKHCNKCDRDLPVESFSVRTKSADGRYPRCRTCRSEYRTARKAATKAVATIVAYVAEQEPVEYGVCANGVIHRIGCGETSYTKAGGVLSTFDTLDEALRMAKDEEVARRIRVAPCAKA